MPPLPSIFEHCIPRREVLVGDLPDSIFAADLWDVLTGRAHEDYRDAERFFAGTYPPASLKVLPRDVADRLAGVSGGTPVYRLETGFGGGKTHALIAACHVARSGADLAPLLSGYGIDHLPVAGSARVGAFVGEESDPLSGIALDVGGRQVRVFTPWGQLAAMVGGLAGYERLREHDERGVAPSRGDLEAALGDGPALLVVDELVLYMARCFALPADHQRARLNSQWPTFLQTLFGVAARRAGTVVLLTLPSEQDANRRLTGELRAAIPSVIDTVDEVMQTAGRQARGLTPTQSNERAAVLGRRLFAAVDSSPAPAVARAYHDYYVAQQEAGVVIDGRALHADYEQQIQAGYPFHPELIQLFADRLADIPEFQATRGALRLVARTIRATWARQHELGDTPLLQPQHIDLRREELRTELLSRLGRTSFAHALDEDVVSLGGVTHAGDVEAGWPWPAATDAALAVFLHSLPAGSRGLTAAEAALAVGRPGCDLAYVARGLEETERNAWYMRREADRYLFRTRASVNKRFQDLLRQVEPGEARETLDRWVQDLFSGFQSFQVVPFPTDHTAIADSAERVRLAVVHYDSECGSVGAGERLTFCRDLLERSGAAASPRSYRNNLLFLLAEPTRVDGMKEAVRQLLAWERVQRSIEQEQASLAETDGRDFRALRDLAQRGASGVPAEFLALQHDRDEVAVKANVQEVHIRSRVLEAYRILALPQGAGRREVYDLFSRPNESGEGGKLLECYRVDFGEVPEASGRSGGLHRPVAETPILQCLRQNEKLVPEATGGRVVLAPDVVRRPPLWRDDERSVSTAEVWDRLRREPALPILLRPADLLPTLRAGLTSGPDALWTYYNRAEKQVYTAANAADLTPVVAETALLYDRAAAVQDRIHPVSAIEPRDVWDYLWPREGAEHVPAASTARLWEALPASPHFPVLPERSVLWQALRQGAMAREWVLVLRERQLAIGADEPAEWPSLPRLDGDTELWTYEAALQQDLYPRQRPGEDDSPTRPELTAHTLRERAWLAGVEELPTELLERRARDTWPGLTRVSLETVLRDGLRAGAWGLLRGGDDPAYFTAEDDAPASLLVGPLWTLVEPGSARDAAVQSLRPGHGPQPVQAAGTPREALTAVWDALAAFPNVLLREITLTAEDRTTFDNTVRATWPDHPPTAAVRVAVQADGEREQATGKEEVHFAFAGRLESLNALLANIWPFAREGQLHLTIKVQLTFEPPVAANDPALLSYRTALMNAGQGQLEVRAVPARGRLAVTTY